MVSGQGKDQGYQYLGILARDGFKDVLRKEIKSRVSYWSTHIDTIG